MGDTLRFFDMFRRSKFSAVADSRDASFRIPANALLDVYAEPPPIPAVNRIKGGGLIASMGVTSDQPELDLEGLFKRLDSALSEAMPDVVLSRASRLKDAFSETASVEKGRVIIWVLNPQVFALWSVGTELLQRLLLRWADDTRINGATPLLYVQEPKSAAGHTLVSILGDLGFATREPDPDGAIVLSLSRVDGVIVTILAGRHCSPAGSRREWFNDLLDRLREAYAADRAAVCHRISAELSRYLNHYFLLLENEEAKVPVFARHLRELVSQSLTEGESALNALTQCLGEREAGLAFRVKQATGTAECTEWPNYGRGLEVFPDLSMAQEILAGDDIDGPAIIGCLPTGDILSWMAKENSGVGIRIGDPDEPSRVLFIDAEKVKLLSRNNMTSSLFREKPKQWGLRGDPFLWDEMRKELRDTPLPRDGDQLSELVKQTFTQLTGIEWSDFEKKDCHFVERYAHRNSGISRGAISAEFWKSKALPLLLSRLEGEE